MARADPGSPVRGGLLRRLPASVDVAAYRILQEALTNAARHGAATRATALITYRTGALTVQVSNPILYRRLHDQHTGTPLPTDVTCGPSGGLR